MLEFIKSKKLLNIDNNAKTVKGQKYGFMTAILYLAPSTQSGFNVCPQASNGCKKACLFTAGHGAFDSVKQGRINKTRWYIQERKTFLEKIRKEIDAFIVKAKAKKLTPCIRLNGTSDISWENTGLIEEYKSIQWYDYTKIYKRALKFVNGQLPRNYHLTYSLNEDNKKQAFDILKKGGNISAVFRKDLPRKFNGYKVINADQNDLRFLDGHNIIAGLVAKGKAKKIIRGLCLMCELVISTAIKNGDYKYNYIVWVGGCDDHYIYYKDAKRDYDYWISNGYDDVIIEKID